MTSTSSPPVVEVPPATTSTTPAIELITATTVVAMLPETGAKEATRVAFGLGVVLLLVGGGAVVVARRRDRR